MLQVAQHLFTKRSKWKTYEVETFVDSEDDHTFSVHWATARPSTGRLIVIIPGMLTHAGSKYLSYFVTELSAIASTCVINYPLSGSGPVTGDTIPDFSDDRYLRRFLELTILRHPNSHITLVGMSMGGALAIKCQDLVDKVYAVCSPIRGSDSWDSIQGFYYTAMRGAFLMGPMTRLLIKQPTKWTSSILAMLKAKDSRALTSTIEEQTSYVIYKMSIEALMLQLPPGKVTMIHTRDDQIIPYIQDDSPLFARVKRVSLPTGGHLFFTPEQVREIVNLIA